MYSKLFTKLFTNYVVHKLFIYDTNSATTVKQKQNISMINQCQIYCMTHY